MAGFFEGMKSPTLDTRFLDCFEHVNSTLHFRIPPSVTAIQNSKYLAHGEELVSTIQSGCTDMKHLSSIVLSLLMQYVATVFIVKDFLTRANSVCYGC